MTPSNDEWSSDPSQVASRIAQRRLELGLTQAQLADRLGVSRCSVAKMEIQGVAKIATLEDVSKALECTPVWLAWGGEEP